MLRDLGRDLQAAQIDPSDKCLCVVGDGGSVAIQQVGRFSEAHFPVQEEVSIFLGLSSERRMMTIRSTCSASKLARMLATNVFSISIKGFAESVAGDGGERYTPLLAHVSTP